MKMNLTLPANYAKLDPKEQVTVRAQAVLARKAEIKVERANARLAREERKANKNANIVLGKIAATEKGRERAAAWLEKHDYEIKAA